MTRFPHRGVLRLLAAACALVLIGAGIALATGRRSDDRVDLARVSTPRITVPDDLALPRGLSVPDRWWPRSGQGIVNVRGTRCPSRHPRRVGSFYAESSTQIDGGEVKRRSRSGVTCSR